MNRKKIQKEKENKEQKKLQKQNGINVNGQTPPNQKTQRHRLAKLIKNRPKKKKTKTKIQLQLYSSNKEGSLQIQGHTQAESDRMDKDTSCK